MRYDSVARCAMRGASSPAAAMPAVLVIFTPGRGEGSHWWSGWVGGRMQHTCKSRTALEVNEICPPAGDKQGAQVAELCQAAVANPLANNGAQRSPPPSLCMTGTACSAWHAARQEAALAACQPWFQTLPGMYSSVSTEGLLRSGKGEEEGKGQRCI